MKIVTRSRTSEKCRKCPHVENCDDKRLEACALRVIEFKPNLAPMTKPLMQPIIQPIIRDTSIHAQFKEQLEKDFYKHFDCYFNQMRVRS